LPRPPVEALRHQVGWERELAAEGLASGRP